MAEKHEYLIETNDGSGWEQLYETTKNGAEAKRWYDGETIYHKKEGIKVRLVQRITRVLEAT